MPSQVESLASIAGLSSQILSALDSSRVANYDQQTFEFIPNSFHRNKLPSAMQDLYLTRELGAITLTFTTEHDIWDDYKTFGVGNSIQRSSDVSLALESDDLTAHVSVSSDNPNDQLVDISLLRAIPNRISPYTPLLTPASEVRSFVASLADGLIDATANQMHEPGFWAELYDSLGRHALQTRRSVEYTIPHLAGLRAKGIFENGQLAYSQMEYETDEYGILSEVIRTDATNGALRVDFGSQGQDGPYRIIRMPLYPDEVEASRIHGRLANIYRQLKPADPLLASDIAELENDATMFDLL